MKKIKTVLYCGDSPVGGPANYLLGILRTLPIRFVHVPPSKSIDSKAIKQCDALILSDYPRNLVNASAEESIRSLVEERKGGLLMVGGWGSFTGLNAGWKGSLVESLLPVRCLAKDDRRNVWTGLLVSRKKKHSVLAGLPASDYPVICGLNEFSMKKEAELILSAKVLRNGKGRVLFSGKEYPLLVFSTKYKTAALATDLAPHWCGGWVDWGVRRVALPVDGPIQVEIGRYYLRFVQNLISSLLG